MFDFTISVHRSIKVQRTLGEKVDKQRRRNERQQRQRYASSTKSCAHAAASSELRLRIDGRMVCVAATAADAAAAVAADAQTELECGGVAKQSLRSVASFVLVLLKRNVDINSFIQQQKESFFSFLLATRTHAHKYLLGVTQCVKRSADTRRSAQRL